MGLNYVQITQDYPTYREARPATDVNKRLVLFLLLLPPCALVVVFLLGFLPSTTKEQEWKIDDGFLLIYNRSVKRQDKSSCLTVDNTFADAGIVPNSDDPNLVTVLFFLRFLIDVTVHSSIVLGEELKTKLICQENILQSIRQRVDTPCDDGHEKEIASSVDLLKDYLHIFIDANNIDDIVTQNMEILFDDLIPGQSDINIYVVHTVWDAIKCIDERSGTNELEASLGLIINKVIDSYRNKKSVELEKDRYLAQSSARKLLNRIQDKVLQIRMDEDGVSDGMRRTLETLGGKDAAVSLLQFLEANYQSRKWLVVVTDRQLNYDHSRGFHTVEINNSASFAAAISADRDDSPTFTHLASALFNEFKFPIVTVSNMKRVPTGLGLSLIAKDGAHDIHQYFNRYLAPLWTDGRLGVESIAITTPCGKTMDGYVSVSASKGFKWKRITNQDDCANKHLIVVPTTVASEPEEKSDRGCLLRNEYGRVYLSVEGNSKENGALINLELYWKNSTGQRWWFVNNQLVNDNGKCLTAWTEKSWYLYQYDCHPDWAGQIWIRHGLQIVNGFRFCLAFIGINNNDSNMYVIQDICDSTPPFLWYDWRISCQENRRDSQEYTHLYLD